MSRSSRMACVLAVVVWGAQVAGAIAQEARNIESLAPAAASPAAADSTVEIEKECIGAENAQLCWLRFTDGTRCVVASNADGGDNSTALNCHFSTPMERLHRLPKD
jgi:hypothetical protein